MNRYLQKMKTHGSIMWLLLIITIVFTTTRAQNIVELENDLFKKLMQYHSNINKSDSLSKVLDKITLQLENLKKDRSRNEEKIVNIMSSSVGITNQIKQLKQMQETEQKQINRLRTTLYAAYEGKIDSLKSLKNSQKNNLIAAEVMLYTEKKLLVQPKLGVLSIDPLRLLSVEIKHDAPLSNKILKEYFQDAIAEVDSHLTIIDNSLSEANEITALKEQSENFLEETSLESETRSLNLFSYNQSSNSFASDPSEGGNRNNDNIYAEIKNTTLLGANTFSTILRQLSTYSSTVYKSKYNKFETSSVEISLEDYSQLLNETKKKLTEYRQVLSKRLSLFNEE